MLTLKRLLKLTLAVVALAGVFAASLALAAPQVVKLVSAHRSDHERISLKPLAERSLIFDAAGNLQGTMTNQNDPQNREQVPLVQVPDTVKQAVLSSEDADFFRHTGINIRSILRAANADLSSGGASQGGSTITQQVVKNALLTDDQKLSRKLREAFLAVELEKQMTKEEILQRYLNSIYLGGGAYGVQAASQYYFGKDVSQLGWAEGALLAGIIPNPSAFDPFKYPAEARRRRKAVLGRLVETGHLTEAQAGMFAAVDLPTKPNRPTPPYDYFLEEVKEQLLQDPRFGLGANAAARSRSVYEGGIRVYTTFDPNMQYRAIQSRNETLPKNNGDATFDVTNPLDGSKTFGTQAIVSIEPSTGAVRAMVGGPGFERWKFNLATERDPGRQPGSTMKGFVLATMFEQGYVPTDTISGGRCAFKDPGHEDWTPATGKTGYGTITRMTQASSNCAFARMGQLVGVDKVAEMANRLGIKSSLYLKDSQGNPTSPPISLPLGTMGVSPFDMAAAYSVFANDGVRNDPYYIERIENRFGQVIYQHQAQPTRVIDSQVARLVSQVLQANVQAGTGTRAQIQGGQPAAGKTGTTNDSTDVWFVGFTPKLTTAIWMGAPLGSISLANAGLGGATGGRYPAATWGRYYSLLYADDPHVDFFPPLPTRAGSSISRIPNEVGGSGIRTSSGTRRTSTGTTTGTVTTVPTTTPTTVPVTVPG